ncbi:MAG: LytR C-terminal domain-containing protein, partial [Patescibacteria group bacterium]
TYTNPVHVQKILQSLSEHITTNLNFGQMMYLANLGKEADEKIKMLVLDNSETGFLKSYIADSGAYMLTPKTGNFGDVNLAIKNVFEEDRAKIAQNLSVENKSIFPSGKIQILNGTWRAGLAAKYQQQLQEKGFSTLPAGNSPKRPIALTTIYIVNSKISNDVVLALQKEIKAQTEKNRPDWLVPNLDSTSSSTELTNPNLKYNTEADIIIILGTDLSDKQ